MVEQHNCWRIQHYPHHQQSPEVHIVLEAPHAARKHHWDSWCALVDEPWKGMDDLFWCTTDQGVHELIHALAVRLVSRLSDHHRTVQVTTIEGTVPRTFSDLNRRWHAPEIDRPEPWHTGALARTLRHTSLAGEIARCVEAYHAQVQAQLETATVFVQCHTYAPITVKTRSDQPAHVALRRAYHPHHIQQYPKRPDMQLMTAPSDDRQRRLTDVALIESVIEHYLEIDVAVRENNPFALHPLTVLTQRVTQMAPFAFGVEWSRSRLATRFSPFREMSFDPQTVERWASPMADALGAWFEQQGDVR